MNSPPDFSRRIPQLDGLRGVAIAMVVIFHYVGNVIELGASRFVSVLLRSTSLGWSGVDLFFVLSGFLIGGILLDARESTNYFRVFYRRRLCRIFPLYFAFLTVFLFAAHFSLSPELQPLFHPAIPWQVSATFCQNFWMTIHNTLGAAAVSPTWSLAVEEQFYLTIPAVIYFVSPRLLIRFVVGGIVLAPLIRFAIFTVNPQLTTAIYVLLPCRMDSLLFGVAAAYFLRQPGAWEFVRAHRRQMWTAIELLTVVCALLLIPRPMFAPLTMLVGYDCLAILYVCILVTSLVDQRLAGVLQAKWLRSLGAIAYCVYLIHQLLFALVFALLKGRSNAWSTTAIIALVLTIIVAKISWEWFEKPLVRLGHRDRYESSSSVLRQSAVIAGLMIPKPQ
jgi:peptidoglycan/LPS O-acetylase OafA/YrhL